MEQRHRDVLRDNWVYLIDNLSPDFLLPLLYQNRILSQDLIDQIESEATLKRKNYAFLTILQRRGSNAFPLFLQALVDSDQNHIRERLQPGTTSSSVATMKTTTTAAKTSQGNILRQPEGDSGRFRRFNF